MDDDDQGIRQVADALNDLLTRLRTRLRVSALVVFGSRARDDYLMESDVDVAVISPDFEGQRVFDRGLPVLEEWNGPVAIEVIALTPNELMSCEGMLCWDILADGIPIYDDGTVGEARNRFGEYKKEHGLRRIGLDWEWDTDIPQTAHHSA